MYLIKWKGYDESQNTWEPEGNLRSCNHLVAVFENRKMGFNMNTSISSSEAAINGTKENTSTLKYPQEATTKPSLPNKRLDGDLRLKENLHSNWGVQARVAEKVPSPCVKTYPVSDPPQQETRRQVTELLPISPHRKQPKTNLNTELRDFRIENDGLLRDEDRETTGSELRKTVEPEPVARLEILKRLSVDNSILFKVVDTQTLKQKMMTRAQLLRTDPISLVNFYEKHIVN